MPEYKILSGINEFDLEDKVTAALQAGFIPVGGVSVNTDRNAPANFHQAVMRPATSKREAHYMTSKEQP